MNGYGLQKRLWAEKNSPNNGTQAGNYPDTMKP